MTGVRSARIEALSLPIRGFNTELPLPSMPPEFSPWLLNVENEGYLYKARQGINYFCETAANYVSGQVAHPTDKTKLVFVDSWSTSKRLVSITAGSPLPTTIGTLGGASNTAQVLSFNYERHSYFFYANSAPSIFDGTTFSNMTITGPTAANVIGGCAYRNRLYLFESSSGSLWYSELPRNVQGTFIEFPTTGSIQQSGNILCAFSVTTTNSVHPETYLGVHYDTGEVVLFRGTYPGSADWQVAGVFNAGTPIGTQSYINVEGDVWLMTYGGITSVRQLINGISANKITGNISKYWEQLIKSVSTRATVAFATSDPTLSLVRGAYHQGRRKVFICFPGFLQTLIESGSYSFQYFSNSNMFLTYDVETESWIPGVTAILVDYETNSSFLTPYYWNNQDLLVLGSNNTALEIGYSFWDNEDYLTDYHFPVRNKYRCYMHTAYTKSPYVGKVNSTFISHEGNTTLKSNAQCRLHIDYANSKTGYQNLAAASSSIISRDQFNIQAVGNSISAEIYIETENDNSLTGFYNIYTLDLLKEDGKGIS